jgi:transcriptional regulator with XRE-family HTH domain
VTFQQVQKYENGTNRVGASRLSQIANVLEVPLSALFEGRAGIGKGLAEQSPHALLAKPHALRLLQAFHKIQREPLKVAILKLIESLAS